MPQRFRHKEYTGRSDNAALLCSPLDETGKTARENHSRIKQPVISTIPLTVGLICLMIEVAPEKEKRRQLERGARDAYWNSTSCR